MNSANDRRRAYALEVEGGRARDDGDRASAERSLREALSVFALLEDAPGISRVLATLAELQLAEQDFGAAVELGRQAVERMPGDVDALTVLGYGQWLSGSPADAEVTFGHALHRDRCAVRALAGRGQVRAELGDYHRGLLDLGRAIEIGVAVDDEADVYSARALALAGLGRFAEAEAEIAIAMEQDPGRARVAFRAAWIAVLEGRFDEVRDELRRIAGLGNVQPSLAQAARRLLARHLARH